MEYNNSIAYAVKDCFLCTWVLLNPFVWLRLMHLHADALHLSLYRD
jgi:hypothetical protein